MFLSILVTTFLSTYAAGQVTTSIWLPGAADTNQSFVGSVIAQNDDHMTLSLAFAKGPVQSEGLYTSPPKTVTLEGTSVVAYSVTGTDQGNTNNPAVTISVGCSRSGTSIAPTCTMSTLGFQDAISALCAGLTAPAGYCTNSAALNFAQTVTLNGGSQPYLNNFQLVITAGEQKLKAAAATTTATATATMSVTSMPTSAVARTISGSVPRSAAGSAPSQTSGGSVPSQSSVSNAGAKQTIAGKGIWPIVMGLQAIVAVYFF